MLPLTFQKVFNIIFYLLSLFAGFLFSIFLNRGKSNKSVEGVADINIAENRKPKFGIENCSDKHFHPYIETVGHYNFFWFFFVLLLMKVRRLLNSFV